MALAEWRHLDWVVADECWLHQILLAILTKDCVNQLTLTHCVVNLNIQSLASLAQLSLALACDVIACLLADGIGHCQATEWSLERNLLAINFDLGCTVYCQSDTLQHILGELHHPAVVLVCDIDLHTGKLRVVSAVHTLVTEVLAELVNTIKATHDKTLEVQLGSDSHIEVDIECVVVSDERTSRSTTRNWLKDWSLNLQAAVLIEILTHSSDNLRTLCKHIAHLRINHQINITLTIAYLRIGQSIELLTILLLNDWEWADRLRQYGKLTTMYRQLACIGAECKTLNTDKVANIEQLLKYGVIECWVALRTDVVTTDIYLNTTCVVLQLEERCATHNTAAHNTTGDGYCLELRWLCIELRCNLRSISRHIKLLGRIRVNAEVTQRLKRITAQLFLFTQMFHIYILFYFLLIFVQRYVILWIFLSFYQTFSKGKILQLPK